MKKSLIALAALATVGAAQAQSSVTVYGVLDTGINRIENTLGAAKTTTESMQTAGEAATSRLGFRGTEDLGGGLRANFVLESGIAGNTALTFGNRGAWAGLQGNFGEIRVGRQNTGARDLWLAFDQLAAANVVGNLAHSSVLDGTPNSGAGGTVGANAITGANTSSQTVSHVAFNDGVQYITPRVNGLQGAVAMSRNNVEVSNNPAAERKTAQGYSVGGSYVAGKVAAAVSYSDSDTRTDTANTTAKILAVGASYDLGAVKLAVIHNNFEVKTSTGAKVSERQSNAFSLSAPISAKTVLRAGYGVGKWENPVGGDAVKRDLTGYQLAVNHNLSKRTMAYAIYGDEKRETSTTDVKSKEYSVGIRHSF